MAAKSEESYCGAYLIRTWVSDELLSMGGQPDFQTYSVVSRFGSITLGMTTATNKDAHSVPTHPLN
jgi:hypothetical protein